ncbi:hypothetical protein KVR01_008497 [Diaporthe batatas]|uniref:uncharacterized protein n=1 Tax=Diaporthe batatas TaxID=748121 RepID=UPI001D03D370|nr:uncharacterized protein KVR01_008497 [Diaporthe batatas]KAG8161510.1 hypothetical protein KVR01_008497 [Diaporthe batatas]
MSSHMPNPLPPDQNRGPQMMGMFWTMVAISTMMVALRFYARFRIKSIGWDDWAMLMAQLLFVLGNSFATYWVHNGGGRHVWYLSENQTLLAGKWAYISQVPIILTYAFGKTSIALLTLRFIGSISMWRKSLLSFIIGAEFVVNILTFILIFLQCTPSHALWTKVEGASCWPSYIVRNCNHFSRAWNFFVDILLAILPVSFVYKLNLRLHKKIALAGLLSLGLVAALCGGIKWQYENDLTDPSDFTWNGYNIMMWSEAEAFILISAGCVPTLLPLWERYVTHTRDTSYGHTPLKDIQGPGKPKRPPVSALYTAYGHSGDALNLTTINSGSNADIELMPRMPEGILIKSSYGVDHRPNEFA